MMEPTKSEKIEIFFVISTELFLGRDDSIINDLEYQ